MASRPAASAAANGPSEGRLYTLTFVLFLSYLAVGMALPVVPVFVTRQLGLDNVWAGLAVGLAFLSTILTRGPAGILVDRRGGKAGVRRGLVYYGAGLVASAAAGLIPHAPWTAFAVLLAGRLVIGLGESLVAVGIITWGIGLVGPARSGRVLAFVGAAIYGALAIGGPVGLVLIDRIGFAGTMAAGLVLPALGLLAVAVLPGIAPQASAPRPPFWQVIGRIWAHGAIVCLQGIGFATIGAFFALYLMTRGWSGAGLGLTAFGAGFVLVRVFLGNLPDRIGGLPVAIGSLAVEALGQTFIWAAPGPNAALVGAFLTGLGCSMVFPSMGREVVRRVEPHLRGTALGGFSAFQDLAYGLTGPLAGLLADRAGYDSVFLIGAASAALGFVIAVGLRGRGG